MTFILFPKEVMLTHCHSSPFQMSVMVAYLSANDNTMLPCSSNIFLQVLLHWVIQIYLSIDMKRWTILGLMVGGCINKLMSPLINMFELSWFLMKGKHIRAPNHICRE